MNQFEKNIRKGIKAVLKNENPGMSLSKDALKTMYTSLFNLNQNLVESCRAECFSNRKKKVHMAKSVAQNAVMKVLSGRMLHCALAAANQCILKHNAGILTYHPSKKTVKDGKLISHRLTEFNKGIQIIARSVNPDVKMHIDGRNIVSQILKEWAEKLVDDAQQTSKGLGTLGINDIIIGVENSMAGTMAQHAVSEGARNVHLFTIGQSAYTLEDFETLQKRMKKGKKNK